MQIADRNEIHCNALHPIHTEALKSLATNWWPEAGYCLGLGLAKVEKTLGINIHHDQAEEIFLYVLALLNNEAIAVPIEIGDIVRKVIEFFELNYRFPRA